MRAGVPLNAHRWAAKVSPKGGRTLHEGYCAAPGCDWRGTRADFYRLHLIRLAPKRGDER
jgi:hypothetical protein